MVWGLTVVLLLRSLQEECNWGDSAGTCEDREPHGVFLMFLEDGRVASAVGGLRIRADLGLTGSGRTCKRRSRRNRVVFS